ncbi:hypothetical protein F5Y02DRAFT_414482 [Annulohypoxylon stygium]|nr:hypothetical protein F5Y02DRAFT_414482 [Annulohypoxylon stygium]
MKYSFVLFTLASAIYAAPVAEPKDNAARAIYRVDPLPRSDDTTRSEDEDHLIRSDPGGDPSLYGVKYILPSKRAEEDSSVLAENHENDESLEMAGEPSEDSSVYPPGGSRYYPERSDNADDDEPFIYVPGTLRVNNKGSEKDSKVYDAVFY